MEHFLFLDHICYYFRTICSGAYSFRNGKEGY